MRPTLSSMRSYRTYPLAKRRKHLAHRKESRETLRKISEYLDDRKTSEAIRELQALLNSKDPSLDRDRIRSKILPNVKQVDYESRILNFSHLFSIAGLLKNSRTESNLNLEGYNLEGTIPLMMRDIEAFLASYPSSLKGREVLEQALQMLKDVRPLVPLGPVELAQEFERLVSLKKPFLVPLTIHFGKAGHVVLLEVSPQEGGLGSMRIYNSGEGLDHHKNEVSGFFNISFKAQPYVEYQDVPLAKFTGPKIVALAGKLTDADPDVYDDIYDWPVTVFGGKKADVAAPYLKPQSVGNCTHKVLRRFLKVKLPPEAYAQFKDFAKERALEGIRQLSAKKLSPKAISHRTEARTFFDHPRLRTEEELIQHGLYWRSLRP